MKDTIDIKKELYKLIRNWNQDGNWYDLSHEWEFGCNPYYDCADKLEKVIQNMNKDIDRPIRTNCIICKRETDSTHPWCDNCRSQRKM